MTEELENVDILIVEDSPTQVLVLRELLTMHKMIVRVAVDGIEALHILREKLPQVVISDIEMPKMNGYELCKMMKADPVLKKIPVILLTNLKDPLDAIRGIECGANSFLTKPCDTSVLLSTIKNALENKELNSDDKSKYQMEFFFSGQKHLIQVDQVQITELLLSTYANAVQKNTELESAYKRLNQLYDEVKKKNLVLSDLNTQKNKFLGMAAHDMRNPLGAIASFCDLLLTKAETLDTKSRKIIEHIKHASCYMLQLINEFLDISVIESGTVTLNIVEVDLSDLILESLEFLTEIADKKQIHVRFKYDKIQSKIFCDPNKVIQVITNLVINAIKFSPPKSEIEIILEPSKFEMTIIIRDHGTGISTETKKKMFQPFMKGESYGTGGEQGSGLGLAIVQKIVAEHHGKIRVESELEKGTTFYVTLPTKPDQTKPETKKIYDASKAL